MTIGDVEVPEGDVMMLLLAAAQRDPAEFDRPDAFDPDRGAVAALGFWPRCALLPGRAAGAAGSRRGPIGGDGAFPARAAGQRAAYKPNVTLRGFWR